MDLQSTGKWKGEIIRKHRNSAKNYLGIVLSIWIKITTLIFVTPAFPVSSPHIICSHFSKSFCNGDFSMLTENQGSLFRAMETPEPPSKGFFSSLFSSAASPLDREQLCKYWTSKQTKRCVYGAQWVTSDLSWNLCWSRNLFIPWQGKVVRRWIKTTLNCICNCVGGLKILEFVKLFNTALKRLLNHLVLV